MAKKKNKVKATQSAKSNKLSNNINTQQENMIAVAMRSIPTPVLMKVCRLCETKEGPFLNIFDVEKMTVKKIETLMPFVITENDGLPHKICFRCSAKVEELHEFVEKCVKTQESLAKAVGLKTSTTKLRTKQLWEEKLNKSNMTNDDICDALIKKAMEGIKDLPTQFPSIEKDTSPIKKLRNSKSEINTEKEVNKGENLNQTKFLRSTSKDSKNMIEAGLKNNSEEIKNTPLNTTKNMSFDYTTEINISSDDEENNQGNKVQPNETLKSNTNKERSNLFNIMDHISMIKVNGVGVLFQCKLCNRNFLKKEVVMSHGCAKNNVPKVSFAQKVVIPEPPKPPTIKYINTKIDGEIKKPDKPKPRIGPASKVKKNENDVPVVGMVVNPRPPTPPATKQIQLPSTPNVNSRYRIEPGPNNTFSLVEDKSSLLDETNKNHLNTYYKLVLGPNNSYSLVEDRANEEKKDLDSHNPKITSEQPYPVGLFQTRPHNSTSSESVPLYQSRPHNSSEYSSTPSVPFTTPAMKKQSYTVVQTGNPSKLLISTRPVAVDNIPKKKSKKSKHEHKTDEQPFSVTLEDSSQPKDPGFFNFINVDPLLQPSYVLPTDNIIQESQITTSTPVATSDIEKNKYKCSICLASFSREKKLTAHLQTHYRQTEEDELLGDERSSSRKRSKRN